MAHKSYNLLPGTSHNHLVAQNPHWQKKATVNSVSFLIFENSLYLEFLATKREKGGKKPRKYMYSCRMQTVS